MNHWVDGIIRWVDYCREVSKLQDKARQETAGDKKGSLLDELNHRLNGTTVRSGAAARAELALITCFVFVSY